jgi:hypothetical protein
MVEGQAIGDPPAAIMAGEEEVREAEALHDDHHVPGHGPLGIGRVLGVGGRTAALPIAAKICGDHGEIAGQQRGDAAPHQMGLRKAMQQEERRPGAGGPQEDAGLPGLDLGGPEALHHGC